MKRKIIVAMTGASGAVYTQILFNKLQKIKEQIEEVGVIFSDNAKDIWKYEVRDEFDPVHPFRLYDKDDFYAPYASGSSDFDTLII